MILYQFRVEISKGTQGYDSIIVRSTTIITISVRVRLCRIQLANNKDTMTRASCMDTAPTKLTEFPCYLLPKDDLKCWSGSLFNETRWCEVNHTENGGDMEKGNNKDAMTTSNNVSNAKRRRRFFMTHARSDMSYPFPSSISAPLFLLVVSLNDARKDTQYCYNINRF